MLIRRILGNLAKQDWGTAAIELVIVVLGIFLGLQASSWYERQQEQALEAEILLRLQSDFAEIVADSDEAVDVHQRILDGLAILEAALRSGVVRGEDEAAVAYSLGNVFNGDPGAARSPTYAELISSGRLRILSDKDLVSLLERYDERVEYSQTHFTHIRLMQVEYEKEFHRQIRFAELVRIEPRGYYPGDVASYDIQAMRDDPEFILALSRLARFQTFFQIFHQNTQASASEVLEHLSGDD
ncbi:MAG: hypothetical protein QNI99_03020 [Woeseiaceae bacterium]|nr:hypothetical protein [Woeseiaceae bacterium]